MFVINETLARQAFPGTDPIGKRIRLPFVDASTSFAQVIGVVADLRYSKLGTASEPELFMDYAHARIAGTTLTIRTSADPMSVAPSLRALLSSIDRTQPLFDMKPLDVALADSIAPHRLNLLLYEVTPTDVTTFAAAVMTVGVTAFTACCPAVKASLIDPLVALRCDRVAKCGHFLDVSRGWIP